MREKMRGTAPKERVDGTPPLLVADMRTGVDVRSKNGFAFRMRLLGEGDGMALREFFGGMSKKSVENRFNSTAIPDDYIKKLLSPSGGIRAAIATVPNGGRERIIGLAEYGVGDDERFPDLSVAVADEHMGRGVGGRLVDWAIADAMGGDHDGFSLQMRIENTAIHRLMRNAIGKHGMGTSDRWDDKGDIGYKIVFKD